jgi:hypothetical protein
LCSNAAARGPLVYIGFEISLSKDRLKALSLKNKFSMGFSINPCQLLNNPYSELRFTFVKEQIKEFDKYEKWTSADGLKGTSLIHPNHDMLYSRVVSV